MLLLGMELGSLFLLPQCKTLLDVSGFFILNVFLMAQVIGTKHALLPKDFISTLTLTTMTPSVMLSNQQQSEFSQLGCELRLVTSKT